MAYEVTATRRRPQRFEDLVGQEFVADTLKNSIQSGKIAHAYLFSGPRGCGKTSTARILAKALNCEKGPTATPCGECTACKEITAGSSLDVFEIDGASNTSVNDVRQIKDEVLFPPQSCRYKIYIIDEVHMLSTSAFNALLKTIEEPPPYVVFIFATTELQKVPATIKSRCQQFNYRLVPVEKVKEQLALAASEVGIKAEDEALYWIAREATGSMRDSYTLFDQVAAFSDGEITYDKIRDKLGLVGIDRLNELFGYCVTSKVDEVLLHLDQYLQNGVSIEQLITNCTDYLRSILLIKNGVRKESLLGTAPERYSKDVLEAWNSVQIERALDIFLQLYRDIRYSLSPRYELELSLSRICWLKDYVTSGEVKKAIDAVKPLISGAAGQRTLMDNRPSSQEPSAPAARQTAAPVAARAGTVRPNGFMPTFSALKEEYNPDEYASAPEEGSAPFIDGAQLPPKKTAEIPAVTNSGSAEIKSGEDIRPNVDTSDIEKVKAFLINEFSAGDAMLASQLSQTKDWKQENDCIYAVSLNRFEFNQLKANSGRISEVLSKTYGRQTSFVITLEEQMKQNSSSEIPVQVAIIRDTFKGSIVGGL